MCSTLEMFLKSALSLGCSMGGWPTYSFGNECGSRLCSSVFKSVELRVHLPPLL